MKHYRDRRQFLADMGLGFTGLALGTLLAEDGILKAANGVSSLPAKARNVIWLFMVGGVSHLESFDPKPALNRFGGKTFTQTPYDKSVQSPEFGNNIRSFAKVPQTATTILPLQTGYGKRGQSGIEVSDWWPHVGGCVDDLAVIRSLWTTDFNHSAQFLFHTGRIILDGREPSLGSWVHYGLGSLNRELPSFVVLGRPPSDFGGGVAAHTASYLGPEHDGVCIDTDPGKAIAFPPGGPGLFQETQQSERELLETLHGLAAVEYPNDPALKARIKSYELAFGMQTALPDIVKGDDETTETQRLYGLDEDVTRPFGQQCLAARRLVERGVRFVQLYHGGSPDNDNGLWDAHTDMKKEQGPMCLQVDKPIAGLLKDLKRRGLLENTLVVFATEFGRSPNIDLPVPPGSIDPKTRSGRDHHIFGFSVWMAGGGVKGGVVHGRTDELGYHAVEDRHYLTDIHATVLHQLGLDPRQLEIPGRKRLDIEVGRPILEVLH